MSFQSEGPRLDEEGAAEAKAGFASGTSIANAIYVSGKFKSNRYPSASCSSFEIESAAVAAQTWRTAMPGAAHPNALVLAALSAVAGVIILIALCRVPAFIALILGSLAVGLGSGMPLDRIAQAFQEGVGSMLSNIAIVVGLGMVIGKLLGESGGARILANAIISGLGPRRLPWAMLLVGLVVGIPVFFTVGVVLLAPVLFSVALVSRQSLLALGIPLVAGLSIVHGLTPPHPGPMAAIAVLKADPGKTILYSLLLGSPAAIVAGPVFARFLRQLDRTPSSTPASPTAPATSRQAPSLTVTLLVVLLPVLLMLSTTVGDLALAPTSTTRQWLRFLGNPLVAMLGGALAAMYSFGLACGFSARQLSRFADDCLLPAGSILLVVGAGGGFNRILIASGIGELLAQWAGSTRLSPLLLGWLIAALIRISTGSATVAITTGAGIVAPLAAATPGVNLELLVIATGAGSLVLSHVNDGGFWFVKEYFGLSVSQTLQSWTLMETILSAVTLILALAMNALEWNRDLTRPLAAIRQRESHLADKPDRGRGVVCIPDMRRSGVGLCVATQIARYVKPGNPLPGWHSPEQAWAQTQGQLAWYQAMEAAGEMLQIRDATSLRAHVGRWSRSDSSQVTNPIGYVLSLEGADSLVTLAHLERAHAQGLRAVGPAHYGPGTYAQGTDASGGLGERGRNLLREMDRLGMILDVTHLCDDSFWEALKYFQGPVWASHSNCRALVPHNRQFSDEQLRVLVDRGAVIGAALDAWMMVPGWVRGQTTPESVNLKLERIVDHIDHVCQIAGNARHSGIGSDLDGAFGREQCPADLETIADLARIPDMLTARGYSKEDVTNISSGNFIRFLENAWR